MNADTLPVMALSVGERELLDVGMTGLAGQLAAWNYFQSVNVAGKRYVRENVGRLQPAAGQDDK